VRHPALRAPSDGRLARHDLGDPLPADDLCLRAARALQQAAGTPLGADISIEKRLPSGAGLGGGSSDAASTLLALNRLWGLDWPLERLLPIGLALGADVPFFLDGRPARVGGIGEQMRRWRCAGLVRRRQARRPGWTRPGVRLAAGGGVVEAARIAGFPKAERRSVRRAAQPTGNRTGTRRRLRAKRPSGRGRGALSEVSRALAGLRQAFGNSRMTGSGSAVFARAGHGPAPRQRCRAIGLRLVEPDVPLAGAPSARELGPAGSVKLKVRSASCEPV
jgi:4-diphosphocytidyl-2-C-methyl-D-erythritol kinase